jgi:hypothetical protein
MVPVEQEAFANLLKAAREWRTTIIPGTSSSSFTGMKSLLAALSTLDEQPCPHDRQWRVFHFVGTEKPKETCGYCGGVLDSAI